MSNILEENYNLPIQIIPDGLMIPGPHDTLDNPEELNKTRGNLYIITEGSEAVLVDAGFGSKFTDKLVKLIEHLELNLQTIILTHFHYDHVGLAGGVAERFNARIVSHGKDSEYIEKPELITDLGLDKEGLRKIRRELGEKLPKLEKIRELYPTGITIDRLVSDGEKIDLRGKAIEVLHTPGHTPGSISIYVRDTQSLYISDLDYYVNPPLPPELGSLSDLRESLKRVLKLDAGFLGCGHFYGIQGPKAISNYLEKTLRMVEETSGRVLDFLKSSNRSQGLGEVVRQLYPVTHGYLTNL